ncbi:MAG: hypothetical protein IPN61_09120 [Bacteroidetes bacterium]|nr:hypothetical protein [Bacteroidota bacterium]
MNSELEQLIDFALADGVLTEKKKQILYKKANEHGEDIDEFEMILNGKLHIKQKQLQQESNSKSETSIPPPVTQQSNKEGDIKKCPSCGAPAKAFSAKCNECGHEFRNIESSKSINELFSMIKNAEEQVRLEIQNEKPEKLWGIEIKTNPLQANLRIATAQESIISSFPISNTREDILEFLTLALPLATVQIKKLGSLFGKGGVVAPQDMVKDHLKTIWKAKCEQVIMKARFSMKNDKNTLEEIENYAKQLGIK